MSLLRSVRLVISWLALLLLAGAPALAQEPVQDGPQLDSSLAEPVVVSARVEGLVTQPQGVVLRALGIELQRPFPNLADGSRIESVFQSYGVYVTELPAVRLVPGGLDVVVRVTEFAVDLEPQFIGNDTYSIKRMREWAGLTGRSELYLYEADGVVQKLTEGYRQQGFHWVEVEWVAGGTGPDGRHEEVVFVIREGPKVRCTGLEIRGNESLPEGGFLFWSSGLRSEAKPKTKGRGILRWLGGVFEEEVLQADLVAMREVYRNRGFLDAKVEIEELIFNEKRNRVKVKVVVDEGPLYRVGSLKIVGVEEIPDTLGGPSTYLEVPLIYDQDELLELVELEPGAAYEGARLTHDQLELGRYYGRRGHLEAGLFVDPDGSGGWRFLTPDVFYDVEKHEVHVTYRIVQGRPLYIRRIDFEGNLHTRDHVLRSEVSQLPGKPADLDELQRSLNRLRGSGYYSDQQDPAHPPATFRLVKVPGKADEVDVVFSVEEGRVVDFQLSGGVASDSGLVGLLSLQMRNFDSTKLPSAWGRTFSEVYRKEAFHGNGETLSVNVSPGSEVSFWSIAYNHPDLFAKRFDRWGGGFEALNRDRIYTTHDEERTRYRLDATRYFGQGDVSLRVGPVLQRIEMTNLQQGVTLPSTLTQTPRTSDFHGAEVLVVWSQVDNRLVPRDGFYVDWRTTFYGGPFGGDNDLVKSEVNYELFQPLGVDDGNARPGIYLGAGAGWAVPFGDTEFVHFAERYFLGGSVDLRGFDFRGVGPNEGQYALGGESMVKGTLEYRYPIYTQPIPGTSRRQEVLRLSPFLDWGVLNPAYDEFEIDQLRATAGVSFSLVNPIPISFSFGWPIEEGPGDQTEVFSFRLSLR